jgi:hypothetical protein
VPTELEVWHYYPGLDAWQQLPVQPVAGVDEATRHGRYAIGPDFDRPGPHSFMVRGFNAEHSPGQFRCFQVE